MIKADFYQSDGKYREFTISGHAGYAESGKDVVCAAVSSAVQLTVNVLDALGCSPEASAEDNLIRCITDGSGSSSAVIMTLMSHLKAILMEFPQTIKITIRRCKYV